MIEDVKSCHKSNREMVMYNIGLRKKASDWKGFIAQRKLCTLQGWTEKGKKYNNKMQTQNPVIRVNWTTLELGNVTCSTLKTGTFTVSGLYVTRTKRQRISIEVSWALLTVWPFVPGEDSCWIELIWLWSLTIYLGQSYLICGCQAKTGSSEK